MGSSSARPFTLVLLLLFGASSCTMLRKDFGQDVDWENCPFEEDRTRVGEVLEELGPPAKVSAVPGGFVFLYQTGGIREHQLGFGLQWGILKYLKLAFGRAGSRRDVLVVAFDHHGTMEAMTEEEYENDVGSGLGIQFFVAVEPVVDTSGLELDSDPNLWGMGCLRSLPETLNRQHSLQSGARGFSQMGEATGAGQSALELR